MIQTKEHPNRIWIGSRILVTLNMRQYRLKIETLAKNSPKA